MKYIREYILRFIFRKRIVPRIYEAMMRSHDVACDENTRQVGAVVLYVRFGAIHV